MEQVRAGEIVLDSKDYKRDSKIFLKTKKADIQFEAATSQVAAIPYVSKITLAMEPSSLPTEILLTHPQRSLGNVHLDWSPQPGAYLEVENQTYTVLERRHRYQLKSGQYQLHRVALFVQPVQQPAQRSLVDGQWVLGNVTCRFNARSALLRCAVNPSGPCDRCHFFEAIAGSES